MKILIIGSQHGNERLGVKLYDHIKKYRSGLLRYVSYKLANPKAFKQNVRYIETDMNRSYDNSYSYEASRAKQILQYIDCNDFTLVLDIHTTTCEQPPCLIVETVKQEGRWFIAASSITHIIEMRHPIVKKSLNGMRPNIVSIEANRHVTKPLLDALCDDIERYCNRETVDVERYVYTVTDLVAKSELSKSEAEKLINFQLSPSGFYPVLVGENSYKRQTAYLGFKAYERYSFKV